MEQAIGPLAWIVLGLALGVAAKWVLPGRSPGGCGLAVLGAVGGLAGGLLATGLGFGGLLAGLEPRALMVAGLGAVLFLLAARLIGRQKPA
jgi:uncharacterized membrane protein YeaQ/YmgE (transglycosylase-associated protein family)